MFQTPDSRVSKPSIARTSSCADSGDEDDNKENIFNNGSSPKEPNVDERKRNQKRIRDEEDEEASQKAGSASPSDKKLDPRKLVYADDDVLGAISSIRDDEQDEVVPVTQPYPPESADHSSQEAGSLEEGECSQP